MAKNIFTLLRGGVTGFSIEIYCKIAMQTLFFFGGGGFTQRRTSFLRDNRKLSLPELSSVAFVFY